MPAGVRVRCPPPYVSCVSDTMVEGGRVMLYLPE